MLKNLGPFAMKLFSSKLHVHQWQAAANKALILIHIYGKTIEWNSLIPISIKWFALLVLFKFKIEYRMFRRLRQQPPLLKLLFVSL